MCLWLWKMKYEHSFSKYHVFYSIEITKMSYSGCIHSHSWDLEYIFDVWWKCNLKLSAFDIFHMNLYCNFRSNSNITIKTHLKEGMEKSAPSFGRPYGYKESKQWYLLKKRIYECILLQINVHLKNNVFYIILYSLWNLKNSQP